MAMEMLQEKIYIDPSDDRVFLETYAVCDENTAPRDAILVIPGGGYKFVAWREGIYPALAFLAKGVNTFVLTYSIGDDAVYPRQLSDAARAIKYIKDNADKYHIDPDRIFALGFSAGGHLLGELTVHSAAAEKILGTPEGYLKPCGSIFCYPVITALDDTHKASFENLLKKPFDEISDEEKEFHSIETQVKEGTPPAFVWHTSEDSLVPIYGSLRLAAAYHEKHIPVELHIYPYGDHGIDLANELTSYGKDYNIQPKAQRWVDDAFDWMQGIKK